jgi:hypothetical protein
MKYTPINQRMTPRQRAQSLLRWVRYQFNRKEHGRV